ncbi:MAG TPA: sulfotransferase [Nocardioidaceae bacterium]|nr:sulfotransferase [Nocardioidaceae bacterium]
MQLIIAGFHRSGTSLLTQLLHSAGLFVGDRLLDAKPSNPYGHFEDRDVLRIHRQILRRHGDNWLTPDTPYAFHIGADHWEEMRKFVADRDQKHSNWGFKDPRVCLFMGPWKYLMPDAKVVIVYRDPGECVRSLEARQAETYLNHPDRTPLQARLFNEPDHGLRLWESHNRALVSFAREHEDDCLVMPFTQLTENFPVVAHLNARFGADLEPLATDTVFDPKATSRRESPQRVFDAEVGHRVEQTWAALTELAARTAA